MCFRWVCTSIQENWYKVSIGIRFKALKRHGTSGCVPHQTLQLVPTVRWNRGVGVQGKAVDTGTARSFECEPCTFRATARADAAHVLPGAFPKGNALLDRGRHGASKLPFVVTQRIIPGGHRDIHSASR